MKGRSLVLGASGLLGQAVVRALAEAPAPALGLGRDRCDIRDFDAVVRAVRQNEAAVVYNCAAFTDVDGAERDPDAAFAANAVGAHNVALAAAEAGAAVVHVSTDFIFDGDGARPFDEHDAPAPRSVYARSKWAGEELVRRHNPRHFVVRSGGLYGTGGKNFPSTLLDRLRAGQPVRADRERKMTPTWVRPLAAQIVALAATHLYGTYHATCQGETSFYEFARAMARAAGLSGAEAQIAATDSGTLGGAPRPRYCVLDNRMLRLRGLDRMPSWLEAIEGYVAEATATKGERT